MNRIRLFIFFAVWEKSTEYVGKANGMTSLDMHFGDLLSLFSTLIQSAIHISGQEKGKGCIINILLLLINKTKGLGPSQDKNQRRLGPRPSGIVVRWSTEKFVIVSEKIVVRRCAPHKR